jgi:SPP1 family predicted phage head-tail adaptor
MNIGAMDRRITLQRPNTTTNDYGERVVSWFNYAQVWAQIARKPQAREVVSGEQVISLQSVTFLIRNSSQVSTLEASHRVSYGAKVYDVVGVQEVGRDEALRVVTELRDNS